MSDLYLQEPPFSLQIELVEGCQLACSFCGINGIREHPGKLFKYMTRDTLSSLITQITDLGWNPRVEFAMHGEPTMHPDYVNMIALAYSINPKLQLMLTTNGGGLLRPPGPAENIKALFRNGLNILALDDYDSVKIISKIRPVLDLVCAELIIRWFEYPASPEGNPHKRVKDPFITIIEDISRESSIGTHSHLSNHSGSAAPLDLSMSGKRCHRPFRELSVRWDGNVALCCDDWRGTYQCGNIVTDGVLGVWHSLAMDAARKKLVRGERDFGPCYGCTAKSFRVGLLPDKLGQVELSLPDADDYVHLVEALSKGPLTKPVKRPWEANDADNSTQRERSLESRDGVPERFREAGAL